MTESLITISITGLIAGFIFSMPIAGPVSILIVSNALKGRLKYCNLLTIGASFADIFYVFIAVFGLTKFYSAYKPAIPYIMAGGSLFILFISYRIFRTNIDLEHIDSEVHLSEKIKRKGDGGFYTGFLVNFLNPTLFFGSLTSSFIILSVVASLGFNIGGLDAMIDNSINDLNNIEGNVIEKPDLPDYLKFDTLQILKKEILVDEPEISPPRNFDVIVSLIYAVSLAIGGIIWFFLLTQFIFRCRQKISVKLLNLTIRSMGAALLFLGFFILYKALTMIF